MCVKVDNKENDMCEHHNTEECAFLEEEHANAQASEAEKDMANNFLDVYIKSVKELEEKSKLMSDLLSDINSCLFSASCPMKNEETLETQELLSQYQQDVKELQSILMAEVKEKLDKASAKNKAKTDQVLSLVKKVIARKRVVCRDLDNREKQSPVVLMSSAFGLIDLASVNDKTLFLVAMYIYTYAGLMENIIVRQGLTGEEKFRFRQEQAVPLWQVLRLSVASAILDAPKDNITFKVLASLLRSYDELICYMHDPEIPFEVSFSFFNAFLYEGL